MTAICLFQNVAGTQTDFVQSSSLSFSSKKTVAATFEEGIAETKSGREPIGPRPACANNLLRSGLQSPGRLHRLLRLFDHALLLVEPGETLYGRAVPPARFGSLPSHAESPHRPCPAGPGPAPRQDAPCKTPGLLPAPYETSRAPRPVCRRKSASIPPCSGSLAVNVHDLPKY